MVHKLTLQGFSKTYGKKQLYKDISLEIHTGDIIGIFGKNGSGKSTLLKSIFGEVRDKGATLSLDHKIIHQKHIVLEQKIGYLPQDPFLPKEKKVRDVIPMLFPDGEDQDLIFYTEGIHRIENTKVGLLSLGELRYLEVVLMMNLPHPFLLLDEPFSMIQPLYKEKIVDLIQNTAKRKGILLTDHYYRDILQVANSSYLLYDQQLKLIKTEEDLKSFGYLNK